MTPATTPIATRRNEAAVPPCKGCEFRSELCHGSCTEYKAFKDELERVKAEERKRSPAEEYASKQILKHMHCNFMKTEKRNRKRF
nr:MAG TPA: hypothetical protein [Caudoviricetes sp.]